MKGFKIKYRNGVNGTLVDWTPNINVHNMSAIKRRVESKVKGEAGIIGYDKVNLTLRWNPGSNPVYQAFSGDLSSIQRYIFEIFGIKDNNTEVRQFVGIADFSSLDWPDLERKISFNVIDKLKALDILTSATKQRGDAFSMASRLDPSAEYVYMFSGAGSGNLYPSHNWSSFGNCGDEAIFINFYDDGSYWGYPYAMTQTCVKRGETVVDSTGKLFFVMDAWLAYLPTTLANDIGYNVQSTWVRLYPLDGIASLYFARDAASILSNNYYGLGEEYIDVIGAQDANGRYPVVGFDALKILTALVKVAWPNDTIINRIGTTTYPISLDYFTLLTDEMPLGKHPFDAAKMLADSMRCYIYYNKDGNCVVQNKANLGTNGITRTFSTSRKSTGTKKYHWDKLADGVTVTVKSGKTIDGVTLVGTASVQKYAGIKPRNEIKVDIIAPNTVTQTQEGLNAYALTIANEYLDFYGKRHWAYLISTGIYDDMLDWELLDNVTINSESYFFDELDIDLFRGKASFEGVSVTKYDYDRQQVHIAMNKQNYYQSSVSASSSSGTTIIQQQSEPMPMKSFDYQMVGGSGYKVADVSAGEIAIFITVFLQTVFISSQISQFRVYDSSGTLFDINKIMGKLTLLQPQRIHIGKKYTADDTIYLEMIAGAQQAVQGAGFLLTEKFKYAEVAQ